MRQGRFLSTLWALRHAGDEDAMKTGTRALTTKDLLQQAAPMLAYSLGMALVIAISARASILTPLSPVPVTLQVAAVLLAGFLLGPRWGAWSVAQYLGLGLMGAPVFAMGIGGPAVVLQPSFGYLLAFLPAAWVVGALAENGSRGFLRGLAIGALGVVIIYIGGASWLAGYLALCGADLQFALAAAWTQGVAPFVVVDVLKVVLVAGVWSIAGLAGRR